MVEQLVSQVCRFAPRHLVAERGTAALMVDAWNTVALSTYRALGMAEPMVGGSGHHTIYNSVVYIHGGRNNAPVPGFPTC